MPPAPIKNNGKKPGNKKYGLIAAVCTGVFLLVIFVSLYAMIAKKSAAENASRNPLEPMSSASSTAPVVDTGDPLVKYYSLPDFKGSTFAQISRNVDYEGMYEFSIDKKIYDKTQSAGRVISQSPAPGEKVLKGTQVVLTISLGAYEIGIPNVINKTEEQAKFELMKAGFSYQNIEVLQRYDETQTPGVVIEISPNAGKRVNSDAGITIYINSYVAPESSHSSSSSSQSFPWRN
ncbi:MAG: PASTA domain-containing protein [Oscillospiraceae bacterium]